MKNVKFLTVIASVFALVTSSPNVFADSCCKEAKKEKKECAHKCCQEAAKQKKSCEKCNPKPKKEDKK
jgi:hypothetical protein